MYLLCMRTFARSINALWGNGCGPAEEEKDNQRYPRVDEEYLVSLPSQVPLCFLLYPWE
jgi:hypothetical protein